MTKTGNSTKATFTVIYEGTHDVYGDLVVCIRGAHNRHGSDFAPLNHPFEVMRRNEADDGWVPLEDLAVGQEIVCLATTYCYMMSGTLVTSDAQPQREGTGEKAIWQLDIPEYGVTAIEHCGLVPYDGDTYHIFVAHPGPSVYLTVILEVLKADPLEWIGIRLDEKDRISAIIDIYLRNIGAIEGEEPSEDKEVADATDADQSVC